MKAVPGGGEVDGGLVNGGEVLTGTVVVVGGVLAGTGEVNGGEVPTATAVAVCAGGEVPGDKLMSSLLFGVMLSTPSPFKELLFTAESTT